MRHYLPVAILVLAIGCDSDPGPQSFALGATAIDVAGDGSFTVSVDGRDVFALAPGVALEARTFTASTDFQWGYFRFRRSDEVRLGYRFRGAAAEDDAVVLRYAGDAGELSITLRPEAESTTLELVADGAQDSLAVPLRCDADASFLGFGAQYEQTDQRGEAFDLWVREQGIGRTGGPLWQVTGDRHHSYFPVPYFLDARGHGLVVESDERTLVDLCATDPEVAWIETENVASLTLRALHGPTPVDVVRQLGNVHGRPEAPADWAWGPWIAIQGGQDVVLAEADALESADVPFTALWAQDWVGRQDIVGGLQDIVYHWNVDETLYPDLRGLTDELHRRDKKFLGYINPFVIADLEHFAPMDAAGHLVRDPDGNSYRFPTLKGDSGLPDLTDESAGAFVRGFMEQMLDFGMDGWMIDFGEELPPDAVLANGEPGRMEHNRYPVRWQELNHTALRERLGTDYAGFSRSGWLGSQATAQIVWLGDQEADFEETDGLPTVVPAMINLGLSGVPYVGHDIAGYSGGPSDQELFMRWTELGAFSPVMRTHEGLRAGDNHGWDTDAETTAHFRRFARIHEALVPEIAAAAAEAARSSLPIVRHMALAFPGDRATVGLDDQYMLGEDLLVAPVLHQGEVTREVYFPNGRWLHVFTGEAFDGPGLRTVDAAVGTPPVFSTRDRTDLRMIE